MKLLFSLFVIVATLGLVCGHVSITPNQMASGTTQILTFLVPHGCNSTTLTRKIVIQLPPNITVGLKPADKVGWRLTRDANFTGYDIAPNVPAFNLNLTWEIDNNIYQGFPDWAFESVQIRFTLPTIIPIGTRFAIPVWQYCTGGLTYAWISGSSSSGEGTAGADGITISTAPAFTVIGSNDIQIIPTQANVKLLFDKIANLTTTVQALTGTTGGGMTTSAPVVNAGTNTINYFEDSSSWRKADTIAVIAIILAGLSILVSVILTMKITSIEKQNTMLAK